MNLAICSDPLTRISRKMKLLTNLRPRSSIVRSSASVPQEILSNTASLDALNEKMSAQGFNTVPMERFRPNIVIDSPNAFEEHHIQSLSSTDYSFKNCYPCQRCAIPTIDIDTGTRHPEQQPFSVIAELNPMPDNPKAPAFGENAILQSGLGATIQVGDLLQIHKGD